VRYASSGVAHPLQGFGAVPLAREALDGVVSAYRRPGDKVSEWLRGLVTDRINSLDVSQGRIDIDWFIVDPQPLEIWTRKYFMQIGQRINMV